MDKEQARRVAAKAGPVPDEVRDHVVDGLFSWLSPRLPGTISAYLALPGEVDVTILFERLPGWRWVLPRIEDDGRLTFRDRSVPRERHRWGMEQPVAAGPVIPVPEIDVLLIPGLAFDRSGARLGRGGGFYDRVLAERRGDAVAIGVTTSSRLLAAVPTDDHDQVMDCIATEDGVNPPTS